ncbi:MAG: flagellar biosynthetic protein FliR [Gemmatimonadaceae bacterium]|jgi:flagellar biosynthetic protein FliR|nr:flagellar biosynthetic protein FliR [Gemmatimonadaceae bacterium]
MPLDSAMQLAFLLFCRLGGMALVAPFFASRTIPVRLRTAMLVVLTVVLFPVAKANAVAGAQATFATFATESIVGLAIGFGSAIVVGAAQAAGDFMAVQTGLQGASLFDPMTSVSVPTLGQFMTAFTTLLLLASGGHVLMIEGVGETLRVVPPGTVLDVAPGLLAMGKLGGELLSLGILFAAPAIAASILATLLLGVLVKAAPQFNLLAVAFPLQIAAGLVTIGAGIALTATWFAGWDARHLHDIERLIAPMLGTP